MFRVRSVALEVYGVIFYVLFSLGKRKGERNSKKRRRRGGRSKRKVTLKVAVIQNPGGVSVDEALSRCTYYMNSRNVV